MSTIKQKLRSRVGASMILAMMFMMFCAFIGGTVLASATANAQRVAQMAEQQDFLLERSAAMMASDQLQLDTGKYLRMSIQDEVSLIEEAYKVNDGGSFEVKPGGAKAEVRTISFQVLTNTTLTPLHRLMIEATVWRYLHEFDPEGTAASLIFVNFPGAVSATNQFYFQPVIHDHVIEGQMNVTASPVGGTTVSIPDYTAYFSSGRDQELFDFFVDFGDDSQVRMTMNAYSGTGNPITVPEPFTEGTVPGASYPIQYIKVTRTSTTTTVSWEDPLIEKGGAAR